MWYKNIIKYFHSYTVKFGNIQNKTTMKTTKWIFNTQNQERKVETGEKFKKIKQTTVRNAKVTFKICRISHLQIITIIQSNHGNPQPHQTKPWLYQLTWCPLLWKQCFHLFWDSQLLILLLLLFFFTCLHNLPYCNWSWITIENHGSWTTIILNLSLYLKLCFELL